MKSDSILVCKSPFIFLKRVVIIEFLFAFLPIVVAVGAALLFNAQQAYEQTQLGRSVSYPLLLTIVITILQVVTIGVAFTAWYFPLYQLDSQRLVFKRGRLFEDKVLAETSTIVGLGVRQGWLGRRLDYGTVVLQTSQQPPKATVRDIPNPEHYAHLIHGLAELQTTQLPIAQPESVPDLIAGGENQFVEFKASLIWDYRRQMANKDLYEPVMKNIVAFLNASGGHLMVGVDDGGQILGIEQDYLALRKKNVDGWENSFGMAFNKMVGVEYRRFVDLSFHELEGKTICVITVQPAPEPAYLNFKGQETFYLRAGNASQPLSVSQAARYIQTHFQH